MADKKISIQFDASMNISQMQNALKTIQNQFNGLQLSANAQKSFLNLFSKIENQIKDFQAKSEKGINSMADFNAIDKSGKKIIDLFDRLKVEVKSITNLSDKELLKLFPEALGQTFKTATKDLEAFGRKLESSTKKAKELQEQIAKAKKEKKNAEKKDPTEGKRRVSNFEADKITKEKKAADKALKDQEKTLKQAEEKLQEALSEGRLKKTKSGNFDKRYGSKNDKELITKVQEARQLKDKFEKEVQRLFEKQESIISEDAVVANEEKITIAVQKALETIKEYTNELNDLDSQDDFANSFKKAREEIEKLTGLDLSSIPKTAEGFQEMQDVLNRFKVSQIEKAQQSTEDFESSTEEAADATRELNDQLDKTGQEAEGLSRASREVDVLKSRILDFFSISNAIQLFKNAIRNAYETVKELDKAMTETAVVTDFSVGDMWDQLPRYTAAANELGTTTLGAYKTMTLFYQQGLKTKEAFEVGIETMKMARIGNLEYAQATNLMTAALRGFNMELNETSAQRVNDVYSELAAITAADTEEIAKAMTKTASIANSANMEFETTAAFLSQIVETTRESAETAGTAMKTVIARFQELKKSPDEIGEVDGEVVDANQIEGALRTVGVALRDSEGQFRNLDDVFLELASKWDGLDRNTQRYIATIAAGSRQQSRFLAMMSDYDRTMELVSAANNSAGASQRQYEKTLDSLESKLNKLKDAWDEFTMGLTNSKLIKGGVDALTSLINRINALTDILPGATSSIAKLGLAFLGMKGGGAIFNTFLKSTKAAMKDSGEVGAMSFNKAFTTNIKEGFSSTFKKVSLSFKKSFGKNDNIFGTMLPDQDKLISMIQQSQAGMNRFSQDLAEDFETINQQSLVDIDAYEEGMERIRKSADVDLNNFLPDGIKASTEQLEAYNAALRAGNSPREAAIILAQSMKESEVAQQKVLTETNKQQALQNATMVQSVGIKTTSWIATKLSTLAEKKFIGAKTASTIAEKVLTKAIESRTAATLMGLGVVGLVVAALYGLYKLIDYGIQQAKDQSFIYTLQGAQQATDQAKESAQKATEAYDNLNSSLDELGKKYKNLENLTKGTGEWKEAVVDTNQAVLELVEQYGLMAKNKNGVLTIDMNSQEIKDKQSEYAGKQLSTQQALISAQKWQTSQEQAENFGRLDSKIMANNQETFIEHGARGQQPTVMANRVITDELARGLTEGLITPTLSEVNKWLGSKGALQIDEEGLADIINYGKDLQISDERLKSYSEAQAANIVAALDKDQFSENQLQWSSTFLSGERMSGLEAKEYDILENLRVSDKEQYKKEKENFAKTKGYDYINGKFYIGEGEEQQEVKISDQDFKNEYAAMKATENATSAVSVFAKTLEKVNDEFTKKLYKQEEGKALTQKDIFGVTGREEIIDIANLNVDEEISDANSTLYKKADQIWQSLGQEGQSLYENEEAFIREYLNSIKLAAESFASSSEKMAKVGVSDDFENKFSRLSSGAFSGLADKMYDLFITSGSGPTQAIQEQIASMVSAGDEEGFINALNMLDIHDIDSIEKLDTYLKNFNITIKGGIPAIEALEDSIKAAAKATRNWDLEKVKEELKAVQDLERDLQQRDPTDRVFSEQQVNLLLKEMPELQGDFVMTGIDEFTYVGDSMDKLTIATEALRQAYLQQHIDQVDDRFETSNKWKNIMNGQSQKVMNLIDNTPFEESSASESTMGAYSYQEIQKQQEQYQQYQEQSLDNILSELGLSLDGDYETRRQRMIQHYNEYYGTNGAKAEQIATEKNNLDNGMIQLNYAKNSAFDVLNTPTNNTQEKEAQGLQIEGMVKKEAGAVKQVDKLTEALKKQGDAEKYAATTIKGLVVDNIKAEKQIKVLTDIVTKNKDAFIAGNEALKAGETASNDYYSALSDIEQGAKEVFGEFITQDFIEGHAALFEQLAEGGEVGEKAYLQIRQAAHDAAIETLKQDEAIVGSVEEIEDLINKADLDFTINGYADMTDLVNKLLLAYKDADVVKQKIEELTGMTVEFEVEYDTVMIPFSEVKSSGGKVVGTDASGMFAKIQVPRLSTKGAIGTREDYKGAGIPSNTSGGGKEEKPWENPYDKLYNDVQKINQALREREKIERRYQKLLESEYVSADKLVEQNNKELTHLNYEKGLQENMKKNREKQMSEYLTENSDLNKYATYKDGMVQIDWELINSITDEEEGQKIEDYVSHLEEIQGQIFDAEDSLIEIEDSIEEIKKRGEGEYRDLENRIKEAVIKSYQEQIDELQAINDSINDTNTKLLDAMQQSIEKNRQEKENLKTEEQLENKQAQIDYLSQDTSGANDLAIMELEEELEQGQEDYTDTLIDQKITELERQNNEAAAQRERQITIAQAQLDNYINSGKIWEDVYSLMNTGLNGEDGLVQNSDLSTLLQSTEGYKGLSAIGKMDWMTELNKNVALGLSYLQGGRQLEDLEIPEGTEITFKDSEGNIQKGIVDKNGNVTVGDKIYSDVYQTYDGSYMSNTNPETKKSETENSFTTDENSQNQEGIKSYSEDELIGIAESIIVWGKNSGWGNWPTRKDKIDTKIGEGAGIKVQTIINEIMGNKRKRTKDSSQLKKYFYTQYKTGGLADFTGPAWLDGTKTKPEIILNAQDSENFIQLKDILHSILHDTPKSQNSENYGDNTYDIDINVESIGNDYDVEQMASKIKTMISDTAYYRNNNAINLMR